MTNVLYITYDGLLDQLGASQILPYLFGLADTGHHIHILSVEKPQRTTSEVEACKKNLESQKIKWTFIRFEESHIGKLKNRGQLFRVAREIIESGNFDFIHARSYVACDIALKLKRKFSIPYLFDIRGFWIDERIERGLWDLKNPIRKLGVKYYRRKERWMYQEAAHIITLTHTSVSIIRKKFGVTNTEITVIPCAADLDKFIPMRESKRELRTKLSLPPHGFYLSYLGSLGGVYLIDELLMLFQGFLAKKPDSYLLVLSGQSHLLLESLEKFGIPRERVIDKFVSHGEVNAYINCSDLNAFFLKDSFSINASMPTKVGEVWGAGIPIVANDIADLRTYFEERKNGYLMDNSSPEDIQKAVDYCTQEPFDSPEKIRTVAERYFSLSGACSAYASVYSSLSENASR